MYYSKGGVTDKISVPKNYSGNTFRQEFESEYSQSQDEKSTKIENKTNEIDTKNDEFIPSNTSESPSKSPSFLQNISVEDILLLGLIFVIHQENPNDKLARAKYGFQFFHFSPPLFRFFVFAYSSRDQQVKLTELYIAKLLLQLRQNV